MPNDTTNGASDRPKIETRRTKPEEYRAAAGQLTASYLMAPPTDERWAKSLPSWENMISFSSWDGDACVGHAGYHAVETNVPGGALLGTAAITRVGVLPTHTRYGAGTALMEMVMDDAVEQDLPLTSLRASEAGIYRRYGFGIAGDFTDIAIDVPRAGAVAGAAPGRFRVLQPDEIEPATAAIDLAAVHRRPGAMTRTDTWRRYHFGDAIEQSKGAFVVVHVGADGEPDGYTYYHAQWNDVFEESGSGDIKDVMAVSDDVELALWQYLLNVDLVRKWTSGERPVDDLVREALSDRRAYTITGVKDEQWLRLLDVDKALSARSYTPINKDFVVEVVDPLFERNNGRWLITGGEATPTDESPNIVADIDAISALYLGAGSWRTEVALGRARLGNTADAEAVLTLADQLFGHKPLPFCGTFF